MSKPTIKSITPHLVVQGAAKALEFYQAAFGAQIVTTMPTPDGEKLIHAVMTLGGHTVFLVDEFPESHEHGGVMLAPQSAKGTTVTIALQVDDADAAFQQALKAGAIAHMPVADMFWGARYGQVLDPYGHLWEFNQQVENRTPEQMKAALAKEMTQTAR